MYRFNILDMNDSHLAQLISLSDLDKLTSFNLSGLLNGCGGSFEFKDIDVKQENATYTCSFTWAKVHLNKRTVT